jgi:transcription elongation factor GreA
MALFCLWRNNVERTSRRLGYRGAVNDRSEHMTHDQHAALQAELAELEGPKRAAAVQAIKTAREFGDLSENFEYHAAKNDQGMLEARIRKLKDRLRSAVIVEHDTDDHVGVGSVVEIEDEHGETMEVTISAVDGVSPDSPLGRALVGAAVGDVREVEAPRGAWRATIRSIRRV